MIKGREYIIAHISILIQVLLTLICFNISIWLSNNFIQSVQLSEKELRMYYFTIGVVACIVYSYYRLGKIPRTTMYTSLFLDYLLAQLVCLLIIEAGMYFVGINIFQWVFILAALLSFTVLFLYKIISFSILKYLRRTGCNMRSVLIIADEESEFFIDKLIDSIDWGYRIFAICTSSPKLKVKYESYYTVIPETSSCIDIIDEKTIDEVMYCKSDMDQEKIQKMIYDCNEVGVVFRLHPDFQGFKGLRSDLELVDTLSFITYSNIPNDYLSLKIKMIMGYINAFIIILCLSPILICIGILIKLDDGGPVLFKQERVGHNGRLFKCLKFRTMITNAESLKAGLMRQNEQDGPVFKIEKDPRVTKIGRFLRKTSLDELPQFFNVLKGDMSIIGPRPPIPSEVSQYVRWQRRRLSMKPGISCIWQVSGRNNIPFEQWMILDMQYIDNWSLRLDFIIFLKTVLVIAKGDGQ